MVKMRQQFVTTVSEAIANDERMVLLLGDIGVFGFRDVFAKFPDRAYNIGILEQATVSMASGLSMTGFIPVVHTIAPFLVERAYEQLKVDFGYQKQAGNFISVGASYDYASLGGTHHCPADVAILKNIPGMSVFVPGSSKEFDSLFKQAYAHNNPNYYRLSEICNETDQDVQFGKANVIKTGTQGTVIAVGPLLDVVTNAVADMDVTVLYYTTIHPFDAETLRAANANNSRIVICEPYFTGGITWNVMEALKPHPVTIEHIGVPHGFLSEYGSVNDHNERFGLSVPAIREKISNFIR